MRTELSSYNKKITDEISIIIKSLHVIRSIDDTISFVIRNIECSKKKVIYTTDIYDFPDDYIQFGNSMDYLRDSYERINDSISMLKENINILSGSEIKLLIDHKNNIIDILNKKIDKMNKLTLKVNDIEDHLEINI